MKNALFALLSLSLLALVGCNEAPKHRHGHRHGKRMHRAHSHVQPLTRSRCVSVEYALAQYPRSVRLRRLQRRCQRVHPVRVVHPTHLYRARYQRRSNRMNRRAYRRMGRR